MTTAALAIARRLHQAGCRYAFTIPGGEVMVLLEALDQVGIRIILAKHENCAGFMGEGVHHFDGAPAILVTTIGPGLANATNVIANAMQDRVPMIILSGCVAALQQNTYTHQVFDHVRLCEPITKAAFRVDHGTAAVLADKALTIATGGRPGPVLLDVPIDVQTSELDAVEYPGRKPLSPMVPAKGPDFEKARKWLGQAKRPLVIAGVDVLNQGCSQQVETFCRTTKTPLITTYKAKGIMDEDDPLCLGGAGLSPLIDTSLLPLVDASDCIILAGYDPIEMRNAWQHPWGEAARVMEFSAVENTHYMHQAALNFIGDIGTSLELLCLDNLPENTWPGDEITSLKKQMRDVLHLDENWGPAAIIDEARKALPSNTIITADSGAHRILLSQAWACHEPRGLLQSSALCTMGCAVPLAIGRKLAEPKRPVVVFIGDAGLEMFLGELATIRDLKLGIPIIVFVDQSLALIEKKQRGSQLPNLAVDFGATDFPVVAEALGGFGAWSHDRASLNQQIKASLTRDSFTLIAAVIDKKAYDGRL